MNSVKDEAGNPVWTVCIIFFFSNLNNFNLNQLDTNRYEKKSDSRMDNLSGSKRSEF